MKYVVLEMVIRNGKNKLDRSLVFYDQLEALKYIRDNMARQKVFLIQQDKRERPRLPEKRVA